MPERATRNAVIAFFLVVATNIVLSAMDKTMLQGAETILAADWLWDVTLRSLSFCVAILLLQYLGKHFSVFGLYWRSLLFVYVSLIVTLIIQLSLGISLDWSPLPHLLFTYFVACLIQVAMIWAYHGQQGQEKLG